jgi:predicted NAD/FAD-binding protein
MLRMPPRSGALSGVKEGVMARGPSRREVLAGLGALALVGCADEEKPGAIAPRVAVIGGGLAGVSTAWLLESEVPVDLFEAREVLGGNVRTLEVDYEGHPVVMDLGAQYFHPTVYPTYQRLLNQLGGFDTPGAAHIAPSSVTMIRDTGEPIFVSPVLPSRLWPLAQPWNRESIQAFAALAEAAGRLDAEDGDWKLTVEDWLPTLEVSAELREGLVLPWIAGINSGVIAPTRQFSARAATIFLGRALGTLRPEDITYSTLAAGLGSVIGRMASEAPDLTVFSGAPTSAVQRTSQGLVVIADGRRYGPYQSVVLALPGPQGAALLDGVTGLDATRAALAQVQTFEATLAIHRDPLYVHPDATYHSLINAVVSAEACEVSMSMAEALAPLPDGRRVDLWKSWVGHRTQQPSDVLSTETYTHIQVSPQTIQAQETLAGLQGAGGIYFAGGWTLPFDSQETALLSAINVAERLAPRSSKLARLREAT